MRVKLTTYKEGDMRHNTFSHDEGSISSGLEYEWNGDVLWQWIQEARKGPSPCDSDTRECILARYLYATGCVHEDVLDVKKGEEGNHIHVNCAWGWVGERKDTLGALVESKKRRVSTAFETFRELR